jgi:hypothetical protein
MQWITAASRLGPLSPYTRLARVSMVCLAVHAARFDVRMGVASWKQLAQAKPKQKLSMPRAMISQTGVYTYPAVAQCGSHLIGCPL